MHTYEAVESLCRFFVWKLYEMIIQMKITDYSLFKTISFYENLFAGTHHDNKVGPAQAKPDFSLQQFFLQNVRMTRRCANSFRITSHPSH